VEQDTTGRGRGAELENEPVIEAAALEDVAASEDAASEVTSDIAALQTQLGEVTDRHMRLAADFDNYRKRVERDRIDQLNRAQSALVGRLLEVMDDFERFAQHADPGVSAQSLHEGVQLIERKFRQVLESAGLEAIDAENAPFDPEYMEAVASVAAESPDQDDTVSDVFQKGYRFNGTLIRPARVRVRKYEA